MLGHMILRPVFPVIDRMQSAVVHRSSPLHLISPLNLHYTSATQLVQEYLALKKLPPPLGPYNKPMPIALC